ncbi:TonB family protein [bacterium]|nr:TonB family protein [bacterium]MBU1991293.1 TonB family protein [bacterium]
MIRHGNSLLISITIHTVLLSLLFFSWKNIPSFEKVDEEKDICMKLSCVVYEKPEKITRETLKPFKKEEVKPVLEVPKKPVVQAKKVEKKIKPAVKKELPVPVPPIKEEVEALEEKKEQQISEIPEEIIEKQETETETENEALAQRAPIQEAPQEDMHEKEQRVQRDYLNEHLQKIVELLQKNLYYPRSARKRGIVGEVVIKFRLTTDARVRDVEVISSNSNILSRAAVKTIEDLSEVFPRPKEELSIALPIVYSLNR